MFHLRPATRRILCRVAFVLLCVTPTVAVGGWCAYWRSSLPRQALEQQLSLQLGLRVTCDRLTQPRPGTLLLENVELSDPESAEQLASMRLLEATRTDAGLVLEASQPEITATQLSRLGETLFARLRDVPAVAAETRLLAGELTVRWPDEARTFTDISARLNSQAGGGEAELAFRVAGLEMPEPARVRVTRNRQTSAPTLACELHTGPRALPCALLLAPLGIANRLGADSRFRGSLWCEQATDGWRATAAGDFSEVDLRTLTNRFAHLLTGTAQITLQNARVEHGRLDEAFGTLTAGPGLASRSLLVAAVESLHMTPAADLQTARDLIPYERLALGFSVDQAGLTLRGQAATQAASTPPGLVLSSPIGPLLLEAHEATPVVNLVRALVPQSEVLVAATRQTDWLNQFLPLPEIVPPAGATPTGHVRGARRD